MFSHEVAAKKCQQCRGKHRRIHRDIHEREHLPKSIILKQSAGIVWAQTSQDTPSPDCEYHDTQSGNQGVVCGQVGNLARVPRGDEVNSPADQVHLKRAPKVDPASAVWSKQTQIESGVCREQNHGKDANPQNEQIGREQSTRGLLENTIPVKGFPERVQPRRLVIWLLQRVPGQIGLQVVHEFGGVLIAGQTILVQRSHHDAVQIAAQQFRQS